MAFTTGSKNAAVTALTARGNWISLHSNDPGVDGANAVSVARQQTTWGAASGGTSDGTQVTFTSAPAGGYTFYGVWNAQTGGEFQWGFALSPGLTLNDVGTVLMTPRVTFP